MGEAKRRGAREERVAAAIARNAANPPAEKPEKQYQYKLPYRNSALDFLWGNFRVDVDNKTINELRAEAVEAKKKADKTAEERNAARIAEVSAEQQEAAGAVSAG